MSARGKRYRQVSEGLSPEEFYAIDDALKLIKQSASAKFDESVDVSINLGVNAKKSDQNVRGATVLPKGTG
ncbi:MAG: 50S ribosomal protein L1, partial [Arenicellales bacterium]